MLYEVARPKPLPDDWVQGTPFKSAAYDLIDPTQLIYTWSTAPDAWNYWASTLK